MAASRPKRFGYPQVRGCAVESVCVVWRGGGGLVALETVAEG